MNTGFTQRVRRAIPADAESLAQLRHEFRAARAAPVETMDEFIGRCAPWMRARLADDVHWRAWVLDDGGVVGGNVWLQLIEKLPNPVVEPEIHGYVTNFYVRPERRNGGAGSTLLAALLSECETLGVDAVFLWPTARSRPLYARYGFSAENSVMVRGRQPPSTDRD